MRKPIAAVLLSLVLLFATADLHAQHRSRQMPQGIFPRDWPTVPPPDAAAAELPPGYRVEIVVKDLIYPSSVEFDDLGNMYVAEAGHACGD